MKSTSTKRAPAKTEITSKGRGSPAGMSFTAEPYTPPKGDFWAALEALREKYPMARIKRGQKGAAQMLRETRSKR